MKRMFKMQTSRVDAWYMPLSVLFVVVVLISNIASTKLVAVGALVVDAGTVLFPLAYILGDVITEIFGYKRMKHVIWMGLLASVLMVGVFSLVSILPAAAERPHQGAYEAILGMTPRIVGASMVAYVVGELTNASILSSMKQRLIEQSFWKRALASTFVGELLDTVIFVVLAFGGMVSSTVLVSMIVANYLIKCGTEIVVLPLTSSLVKYLRTLSH